jgi:hypothetical protein
MGKMNSNWGACGIGIFNSGYHLSYSKLRQQCRSGDIPHVHCPMIMMLLLDEDQDMLIDQRYPTHSAALAYLLSTLS